MHDRIFQVSRRPVRWCDYIKESGYFDNWFTREIADYVSDKTDRREDIADLGVAGNGYVVCKDKKGEYLMVTSKEAYFEERHESFKARAGELANCTLEHFIKGTTVMTDINNLYDDRFGHYIDDGDVNHGLQSMDAFVRNCDTNVKYYIGGTLDYHW